MPCVPVWCVCRVCLCESRMMMMMMMTMWRRLVGCLEPKTRLQPRPASQPMQLAPRARCQPVGGTGRDGNGQLGSIRRGAKSKKMSWRSQRVKRAFTFSRRNALLLAQTSSQYTMSTPPRQSFMLYVSKFANPASICSSHHSKATGGRPASKVLLLFRLFFVVALFPRPKQNQRHQHHEQQQQ